MPPTSPEVNTNTPKARKIDPFASLLNLTNGRASPSTKTVHTVTVVKTATGVEPATGQMEIVVLSSRVPPNNIDAPDTTTGKQPAAAKNDDTLNVPSTANNNTPEASNAFITTAQDNAATTPAVQAQSGYDNPLMRSLWADTTSAPEPAHKTPGGRKTSYEPSGGMTASKHAQEVEEPQTYNGLPSNTPTGPKAGAHAATAPKAVAKGKGRGNGRLCKPDGHEDDSGKPPGSGGPGFGGPGYGGLGFGGGSGVHTGYGTWGVDGVSERAMRMPGSCFDYSAGVSYIRSSVVARCFGAGAFVRHVRHLSYEHAAQGL
jgi:hypothetical protein